AAPGNTFRPAARSLRYLAHSRVPHREQGRASRSPTRLARPGRHPTTSPLPGSEAPGSAARLREQVLRVSTVDVVNRLKDSTSPYLLQHADNPVDWWPWCDEAFAEAARRDIPVMLSVGYAACHWCHVMAHESFEDPQTSAVLNEHVVAIKVDREERPDVDAVYMTATQAMTGQGGWPMTVFMTPAKEPFFAGTYYPRDYFRQLVQNIAQAWREQRDDVTDRAKQVAAALAEHAEATARALRG